MRQLKYILLFLLLPFTGQGQGIINSYVYATAGGGGSCGDADANAYIADLVSNGASLSPTQEAAICTWYTDLKAAGVYSKINAAGILKWANANLNKVNMVTLTPYVTFTGSPTHGSTGIVFNGSTQYGNLGIAPNSMSQNSAGLGVYVSTVASNSPAAYIGVTVSGSGFFAITTSTGSSGTLSYAVNRSSLSNITSQANRDQFLYATRTSSSASEYFRNSTSLGTSGTTSTAPLSNNIFIGAYSLNGNANSYAACTISFWVLTDGLTGTEESSLYSITNTMLSAL